MRLISAFLVLLLFNACASSNQIKYVNVPIKCNAKMPLKPLKSKNVNEFDYAKETLIYLRECESTLKQCLGVKE
ncbi:hypothetical protein AVBRAN12640_05345 [Campylobacter sp. RM12640]|uniref:hypothetical protein n=1 Tax=unclassified Campylobacter TaxID=2593542 RepID=UPI0030146D59|nr:hypothetical protein [Campylobacter sp. RM12640]MBZ7989997.1 hypothetical protein [Campylobacter sp. RM12635]